MREKDNGNGQEEGVVTRMIFITGDTHRTLDRFDAKTNPILKGATKEDYLIVLGDFGMVWCGDLVYGTELTDAHILEWIDHICPCTVLFIDGNHENFDALWDEDRYPVQQLLGGKVSRLQDHIFYLHRGEIFRIEDKTFLALGGGTSHDKGRRTEFLSWWSQEELRQQDIDNTLNNLKKEDNIVYYIITHAAPSIVVNKLYSRSTLGLFHEGHTKFLDEIEKTVAFDKWFIGHYHEDAVLGEFNLLYETTIKLD